MDVHHNCYTVLHSWSSIVDHTQAVINRIARYWSRIAIFAHPTSPPAFDTPVRAIPFGILPWRLVQKKIEWCGYPIVKFFWRYVYSLHQNTWTRRMDGQTDGLDTALQHRSMSCLYIALCSENVIKTEWWTDFVEGWVYKMDSCSRPSTSSVHYRRDEFLVNHTSHIASPPSNYTQSHFISTTTAC